MGSLTIILNWSKKSNALCALLAFMVGHAFCSPPINAQSLKGLSRDDAQRTLQTSKQDLQKTLRRGEKLKEDVVFLEKERARLKKKLVDTASLVKLGEERLTEFESKLVKLNAQEKIARAALARQHGTITKLLAAMQRMGRNPPPVVVTRREDALAMVRSAMMLASVFPELRGKAIALTDQLKELVSIMTATREQRDQLRAENKRIADTRLKLETLVTERRNKITMHQSELAEIRRTADELSRSVTDLNQLIARLDIEVAKKSKLGEYEREVAALKPSINPGQAARPQIENPTIEGPKTPERFKPSIEPDQPAIATKPTQPDKPAIEIKPSSRRVALLRPGRMKPEIRFSRAKGKLLMPASGKRVLNFGEENTFGSKSKGLSIATRPSAQITSPSDGWVVFAGPFRSYGQLLIINGGEGYHVLLAGLSQIDVSLGQFVIKGEPVGVMSKSPSRIQLESGQNTNPVLYVEFRKRGRPIDPKPWWSRTSKKVQG